MCSVVMSVVTSLSAFSSSVALNRITQLYEIKPRDKLWKYTEKKIAKGSAGRLLTSA